MRSLVKSALALGFIGGATLSLVAATPATTMHRSGPPWISIEYPANPLDASTRAAFLLVHTFHHQTPTASTLSGTAEGLVGGERKSMRKVLTTVHTDEIRSGVIKVARCKIPCGINRP